MEIKGEKFDIHVSDQPVNAMEMIRQESISGDEDDEPFFICDISDIIRKHQIWKHRMPRVLPFYGDFKITNIDNSFSYWKYTLRITSITLQPLNVIPTPL